PDSHGLQDCGEDEPVPDRAALPQLRLQAQVNRPVLVEYLPEAIGNNVVELDRHVDDLRSAADALDVDLERRDGAREREDPDEGERNGQRRAGNQKVRPNRSTTCSELGTASSR